MAGLETSTEQRAKEMGYAFHRESGTVKDMYGISETYITVEVDEMDR